MTYTSTLIRKDFFHARVRLPCRRLRTNVYSENPFQRRAGLGQASTPNMRYVLATNALSRLGGLRDSFGKFCRALEKFLGLHELRPFGSSDGASGTYQTALPHDDVTTVMAVHGSSDRHPNEAVVGGLGTQCPNMHWRACGRRQEISAQPKAFLP